MTEETTSLILNFPNVIDVLILHLSVGDPFPVGVNCDEKFPKDRCIRCGCCASDSP